MVQGTSVVVLPLLSYCSCHCSESNLDPIFFMGKSMSRISIKPIHRLKIPCFLISPHYWCEHVKTMYIIIYPFIQWT
jgi:hypothetical protein